MSAENDDARPTAGTGMMSSAADISTVEVGYDDLCRRATALVSAGVSVVDVSAAVAAWVDELLWDEFLAALGAR